MPDLADQLDRLYHRNSAAVRSRVEDEPGPGPPPVKRRVYPGAERLDLPGADVDLPMPLGEALGQRRSRRDFVLRPLPLETLGCLLYASFGVRPDREVLGVDTPVETGFRPSPSAGGLYPLELYLLVQEVQGLDDGLYHYDPWVHQLERRGRGRFHQRAADILFGQSFLAGSNVLLALTAVFERSRWKYHQRAYRYVWLEAGHVGQNLYLAATALGLLPVSVGGFFDRELDELLRLPAGEEEAIYLVAVGQGGAEP